MKEKAMASLGFAYEGMPYWVTFGMEIEEFEKLVEPIERELPEMIPGVFVMDMPSVLEQLATILGEVLRKRWNLDADKFEVIELRGIKFRRIPDHHSHLN